MCPAQVPLDMEGNPRGKTTPTELGARATLLVKKHAAYIKKVAEVRAHLPQWFLGCT